MRSCPRTLLVVVGIALGACQTNYAGNENSPYYVLPPGTRLVLKQTLTIAPEQVAVWLQDGRVIAANDARVYYPHCKLESRRRLSTPQTIAPDEFIVTRVTRALTHSVRLPDATERLHAALGIGINIGNDGPSVQTFATRLDLGSARQPGVLRLTCGQWGHPAEAQHVTVAEMRRALGDVFALQLPSH